jgi:GNAT superfamily N-acetyltransferase
VTGIEDATEPNPARAAAIPAVVGRVAAPSRSQANISAGEEPSSCVRLKPVESADELFLLDLYASTRAEELAQVPWTDEQKATFIAMQFRAQSAHYAQHYPGAQWAIALADDAPAGRLYVWRTESEIRIMDLTMIPVFRGRGIGTLLLSSLAAESDATGVPLTIHVERGNPARRLYERLGFVEAEDKGVYVFLRRAPRVSTCGTGAGEFETKGDVRLAGPAVSLHTERPGRRGKAVGSDVSQDARQLDAAGSPVFSDGQGGGL